MTRESAGCLAVLYLDLFIPHAHSLKEKRMALRSFKDKVKHKFNVSVAELDNQDKWQRCVLGVAALGTDHIFVEKVLRQITELADHMHTFEVCSQTIEYC